MTRSASTAHSSPWLGGIKLKVIYHEWTADSPVLGRVTIRLADVDTTPLSLLEVTNVEAAAAAA
ncbi:hypothetical protein WME99_08630 [Sorangium sp. So ce136]|uniref:hypothetical protein n=1 Tax=Sorangium sp. So ce136 TaxID=3133284 RepID=UPI003F1122F8